MPDTKSEFFSKLQSSIRFQLLTARLKPCPDTKPGFSNAIFPTLRAQTGRQGWGTRIFEEEMMVDLCRYILQGGNQCQQAAIKGEYYCRHHHFVRKAVANAAPQGDGERKPLPLVFPEDRAAVQINYFLVMQAINDGRFDHKTASLLVRILKACDANLKKGPLYGEASDQRSASSDQEEAEGSGHRAQEDCEEAARRQAEERPAASDEGQASRRASGASKSASQRSAGSGADEFEFWQRRAEIVLKHQDRFLEIEKKYGNAPDYGDRLNALADELLREEAA